MRFVLISSLVLAACGGADCDVEGLTTALAAAAGGATVQAPGCRIEADVTVPDGVSLRGTGGTVIAGSVTMTAGATASTLEQVAIESDGAAGVVVRGSGAAVLSGVEVTATRGIGIGVADAQSIRLTDVILRGPVNADNRTMFADEPPTPEITATHGLIVRDVALATLEDVSVRGFASIGVLLLTSTTTWSGGDADANVSVGIFVARGRASITDVTANETLDSTRLDHGSTFGVVTGTAAVSTTRLSVDGTEGFGLFHLAGNVAHADLTATANGDGGVRLERVGGATIDGRIAGNDFAAVAAFSTRNLVISDAEIADTTAVLRLDGPRSISVGDGIQLVDSTAGAMIGNTTLSQNGRAGILLELGGGALAASIFDGVTIDRGTGQFGLLAQGGTVGGTWDSGVTRDAQTQMIDSGNTAILDTVGAVGPCFFPVADAPIP